MTANEQTRAFRAMTQQVSQLRTELTGAGQSMSRMERARTWGSNIAAVSGGLAAAGAVVAPAVNNQMTYEQRLAGMANTAFAEQDTAGRRTGMQSMDKLIRSSVAVGGGNKESAAETLDTLLASGAVDYKSAERLMPVLQKYSTATGADSKDLAQIAIRLKQMFGISDEQIPVALSMAVKSGQLGSFELKDQAKWLPQQLAAANALGMRGLGDLSVLLGVNQASAITAGTTDEAGNNVVNLLAKINSQDAATAAAKIKFNGKGIDLQGSLVAARGKGINALDAFSGIVDKIVGSNPEYKKLEKQLNNTSDNSSRRQIMESQAKLLEGSSIGKIIADRQALMALIAYRANRTYAKEVISGVNQEISLPENERAGERNFELIKGTNLFGVNQLNNTRDFGQIDAIKPLSDIIGKLSTLLNDYAGAYPGLTKALSGAEIAIKAMAAAAAVFGAIKWFSGRGGSTGSSGGSSGTMNPLEILTGGSGNSSAVPVYVTNASEIGDKKGLFDDILDKSDQLGGRFGRYFGYAGIAKSVYDIYDELSQKFNSISEGAEKEGITTVEYIRQQNNKNKPTPLAFTHDEISNAISSWLQAPASPTIPESANGYAIPPWARTQTQSLPANINIGIETNSQKNETEINSEIDKWNALRARYGQDRIDQARKRYQPWYQFGKGSVTNNETWLAQLDMDEKTGPAPGGHDSWWVPPTAFNIPQAASGYTSAFMQAPPASQPVIPPITATIKLEVDGRTLAETVNEINGQSATRGPQGGPF